MSKKLTQEQRLNYFRYACRPTFSVKYIFRQLLLVGVIIAITWIIDYGKFIGILAFIWFAIKFIIMYTKYTVQLSIYNKNHQSIDADIQALICERISSVPDAVMSYYKIDEDDLKGKIFLYASYKPGSGWYSGKELQKQDDSYWFERCMINCNIFLIEEDRLRLCYCLYSVIPDTIDYFGESSLFYKDIKTISVGKYCFILDEHRYEISKELAFEYPNDSAQTYYNENRTSDPMVAKAAIESMQNSTKYKVIIDKDNGF